MKHSWGKKGIYAYLSCRPQYAHTWKAGNSCQPHNLRGGCDVTQEKYTLITIIIKFNARSAMNEFEKLCDIYIYNNSAIFSKVAFKFDTLCTILLHFYGDVAVKLRLLLEPLYKY